MYLPEPNEIYIHHKNGQEYRVICVSNIGSTRHGEYPVTIVYKDKNDKIWSRSHRSFFSAMKLKIEINLDSEQITKEWRAEMQEIKKREVNGK